MERRSTGPLAGIARLPRAVPALLAGALLLAGLVVRSWIGTLCLAAIVLFLGWLTYLSWPRLDRRGRALRLLMIALLVAVAGTALLRS